MSPWTIALLSLPCWIIIILPLIPKSFYLNTYIIQIDGSKADLIQRLSVQRAAKQVETNFPILKTCTQESVKGIQWCIDKESMAFVFISKIGCIQIYYPWIGIGLGFVGCLLGILK